MGRMGRYIKEKMGKTCPLYVLLGGGALWVAALTVRLTTTPPYVFLRGMAGQVSLPPTWLLGSIWLTFFFLVGAAWGYILGFRGCRPRRDVWRFRGSMYFLLSMVFALLWYRLLFGAMAIFLSGVCLLVSLAAAVIAAICWWRVSRAEGGILFAFALWLLFLLGCQGAVALRL